MDAVSTAERLDVVASAALGLALVLWGGSFQHLARSVEARHRPISANLFSDHHSAILFT